MWRYRSPGFEALLLAELQRQQHCSQFCDTVLKSEGVSLPVHSCVISALSPQLSAALTSKPPSCSGRAHLLEFNALGAGTLLQLGALLYSGEMAGEGEEERQQAISAAARLGIHGLVEVKVGGAEHKDAEVQTDPPPRPDWEMVRVMTQDHALSLWGETCGHREVGTPAGYMERGGAPLPVQQSVNLASVAAHGLPPDNPYLPFTLLTLPAEGHPSSAPQSPSSLLTHPGAAPAATSVAGHAPILVLPLAHPSGPAPPPQGAELQGGSWAGLPRPGRAETAGEGEALERFQGNIPGFINHFLNPGQEEPARGRGRRGRRHGRGGGGGGTGRAVMGARRPRARGAGKSRGAAQPAATVGKEVRAPPRIGFRRAWGTLTSRTGQGGGAVGRMLFLRTRKQMKPIKLRLKRQGQSKVWQVSNTDQLVACKKRCRANRCGRKSSARQATEESIPASSPIQSVLCVPPSTPDQHPYVAPAPSLLHTTALPNSSAMLDDQPYQVDQSDQFDRLLEQFMMGIDILPNHNPNHSTTQSHAPPPAPSVSGCGGHPSSCVAVAAQGECWPGAPTPGGFGSSMSQAGQAGYEIPALQPPSADGELHDILDNFMRSFELQIANCDAGVDSGSRTHDTGQALGTESGSREKTQTQTGSTGCTHRVPGRRPGRPAKLRRHHTEGRVLRQRLKRETSSSSAGSSSTPQRGTSLTQALLVMKRPGEEPCEGSLSGGTCGSAVIKVPKLKLKVPSTRTGKPFSQSQAMQRLLSAWSQARVKEPGDLGVAVGAEKVAEKLRMVPMVSLRRSPLLQCYLDGHRCHSKNAKKISLSNSPLPSIPSVPLSTRPLISYPTSCRIKELHSMMRTMAPIQGTHAGQLLPSVGQFTSTLPWLVEDEAQPTGSHASLAATTTNHTQATESCGGDGRRRPRNEGQYQDLHGTLPEVESRPARRRGEKRPIEPQEQIIEAKRVCLDQEGPLTPEQGTTSSGNLSCLSEEEQGRVNVDTEDIIDVVTVDSIQGHGNHGGLSPEPTCEVEEDILEEEAQAAVGQQAAAIIPVQASETDQKTRSSVALIDEDKDEMDSEEEIDVDGDSEGGFHSAGTPEDDVRPSPTTSCLPVHHNSPGKDARADASSKFFTEAPPSRPGSAVNLGSTGSWEEEEEDEEELDVDVTGVCSPIPPPAFSLARMLKPELRDEEDDDVDVVGGEMACS